MMQYKLALITGASSGLGKALALHLAAQNIPLILSGRDLSKLEEVKKQVSVPIILCAADLCKREERKKLIALIREKTPDLIINNAGSGLYEDALDHPVDEQLEILELNGNALLEITLEGARALIQQNKKGTILNVSSAAAFFSYPKFCVYAASKAFVKQFSEGIDAEVRERGVRVLVACPGQINTDFRRRAGGHSTQISRLSMPVEKAVKHLMFQLETQKSVYVFDWRYRALLFFSRLFPQSLIQSTLKNEIASRTKSSG